MNEIRFTKKTKIVYINKLNLFKLKHSNIN